MSELQSSRREFLKLFGAAAAVAAIPAASLAPLAPKIIGVDPGSSPAVFANVVLNAKRDGEWEQVGVVSDFEIKREAIEAFADINGFGKFFPSLDIDVEATIISPDPGRIESLFGDPADKFALVSDEFEYHIWHGGYSADYSIASDTPLKATLLIRGIRAEMMG